MCFEFLKRECGFSENPITHIKSALKTQAHFIQSKNLVNINSNIKLILLYDKK